MVVIEKPESIVGRDDEWQLLSRFLRPTNDGHLKIGIVSGRRRAGKTYLLTAASRASNGLYHVCVQSEGDTAARARFAATIAAFAGLDTGTLAGESWESLIRTALTVLEQNGRSGTTPLLVLDEFPYAMIKAPELPGILQLIYDQSQRGDGPGGNLVLCGSSLSIMRELLSGTKPLRGRATIDLRLQPLDFRQTAALWEIGDPETALLVHACLGGHPGYRQLIDEIPTTPADFDSWVEGNLLKSGLGMFTTAEVDYLLREDPRITDRAAYYDTLSAVASGETTLAKIGAATGRSKDAVRPLIRTLQETGYLGEIRDLIRRKSTLSVRDPIIRFDRLITAPRLGQLELGMQHAAWSSARKTFQSQILGPHFETIAQDWVRLFALTELDRPVVDLTDGFGEVGMATIHDHAGRARHEIDVIALQGRSLKLLGEAKTTIQQPGISAFERLRAIRRLLGDQDYNVSDTVIAIFSRTGFTAELKRLATTDRSLILVDLARLYGTSR